MIYLHVLNPPNTSLVALLCFFGIIDCAELRRLWCVILDQVLASSPPTAHPGGMPQHVTTGVRRLLQCLRDDLAAHPAVDDGANREGELCPIAIPERRGTGRRDKGARHGWEVKHWRRRTRVPFPVPEKSSTPERKAERKAAPVTNATMADGVSTEVRHGDEHGRHAEETHEAALHRMMQFAGGLVTGEQPFCDIERRQHRQTTAAQSIRTSPTTAGSCQTAWAARQDPPRPVSPRTTPKKDAGTTGSPAMSDPREDQPREVRRVDDEATPFRIIGSGGLRCDDLVACASVLLQRGNIAADGDEHVAVLDELRAVSDGGSDAFGCAGDDCDFTCEFAHVFSLVCVWTPRPLKAGIRASTTHFLA